MEIKLPPFTVYRNKILSGEISVVRVPFFQVKKGDRVKAVIMDNSDMTLLLLGVKNITPVPLQSITIEEARAEGFTLPDFCQMKEICRNIELRLDTDSVVETLAGSGFTSGKELTGETDAPFPASCNDCLLKKDSKELFLSWWETTYRTTTTTDVLKLEIEVLSKNNVA